MILIVYFCYKTIKIFVYVCLNLWPHFYVHFTSTLLRKSNYDILLKIMPTGNVKVRLRQL